MKAYFFPFVMAALLLAGCSKQLDQLPQDTASNPAVFGSEQGLQLYSNSFYNILPSAGTQVRGDDMSDFAARTQVPDFLLPGAYGPRQSTGWTWTDLRNINYFIANCTNPAVSESVRNNYIGLARFFRAWFYFDKLKRFGDVPWISTLMDVTDSSLYKGRDSRVLVVDSMLADLDFAAQNITTTSDATRSLITKDIVYAFISRVCLFEGTFRLYHDEYSLKGTSSGLLQKAADAAQKIMDEGTFSLNQTGGTELSYRSLFISKVPPASEVMLAVICDGTLGVYNDANWYWTSSTYGARVSFTRTFVNTYLNIDGTPFTDKAGYDTMTFVNEVKNRDRRLQQTIRMGSYQRLNSGTYESAPPVFSYTYTGYQPIKWATDDGSMDGGTKNENSPPLIRYAEVLLNYAEAKAELGTLTSEDWAKTIGALRARAGITGGLTSLPTVADPYLKANYFDISNVPLLEIRRERGIELALEGFRFNDIVRWKAGKLMEQQWNGMYVPALDVPMDLNGDGKADVCFYKTLPATQADGVTYVNVSENVGAVVNPQRLAQDAKGELTWLTNIVRKWDDKYYLYPIPESDRLMNTALGQNPGWVP